MSIAARTWSAVPPDGHVIWRKHPSAAEPIRVDFADAMHSDETLQTVTWATPSPVTSPALTCTSPSATTTTAEVLVSAGADGSSYALTCTAVTQGGYGRTIIWRCTVHVRSPVC